jgi:valyl-tRNA synthetase
LLSDDHRLWHIDAAGVAGGVHSITGSSKTWIESPSRDPDGVGPDWLRGVFVLDANAKIVRDLDERGLLLNAETHRHSYPHCWRCKNPVLFRATLQWFISMDSTGLHEKALAAVHAGR